MKQIKSKHLAKADFIRELKSLTTQLYAIGDSSSKDPRWAVLSSKLDGFIEAGLLLQVSNRTEIQRHIDEIHFQVFGETREARRERKSSPIQRCDSDDLTIKPDWSELDAPAYERNAKIRSCEPDKT